MINLITAPVNRLRRLAARRSPPAAVVSLPPATPCAACGSDSLKIGHAILDDEQVRAMSNTVIGRWYPIAREEYGYGEQSLFVCAACGHMFLDPVLSDDDTIEIFFKASGGVKPQCGPWLPAPATIAPPDIWSSAVRVPSVNETLRPFILRPARLLDVGAHGGPIGLNLKLPEGSSVDLLQLENHGLCFTSPERDLGRVREFHGLLSDLRRVDPDYRADVILALQVLEHVADLGRFLGDCKQLLAPDGLLVIEVPFEPLDAMSVARNGYFQLSHHSYFTPWTLRSILERNGFIVRQLELLNHSHTGQGTDPYINSRAVCSVNPDGQVPPAPAKHYNFCRSLDFLLGSFGGSIAFLDGAPFVTFHYDPRCAHMASVFEAAPGFQGAYSTNPELNLPNIFEPHPEVDYIITMTADDRRGLRANYKGRETVI